MLKENIKNLRKKKGLSQEELAIKLNVVRQTISKWEQGLSVPDSEMLIQIAEELDTTVNVLLGETVAENETLEIQKLAAKLELLNIQVAKQNDTTRKIWRAAFIVLGLISMAFILKELIGDIYYLILMNEINSSTSVICSIEGPTAIAVSGGSYNKIGKIIICTGITILSLIGIYKTRRK